MPDGIDVEPAYCPRPSTGIINRIVNILWARGHQGDINHVTGDVHYLALGLEPRRTILTIADCVSLHFSRGVRRWMLWFFWYWLPEKRCARLVAISEFTKQEILRYLDMDPRKIAVIHCPVPLGLEPKPRPLRSGTPVVLQVGTDPNKNLETVADALRDFPCILDIVGPLTSGQRILLERNGVAYRNYTRISDEDLRKRYEECDLVVFASLYEGFGLPIIEAQTIGRPVVTSNTCSMPEIAGDGAHMVNPSNAVELREAILEVVLNDAHRENLVRRGAANVVRFEPGGIARQYAELYNSLPLIPESAP